MGVRFYRRVRVLPGVRVNVSLSGPSVSVGLCGAHVTFGRRGITRTVGLPGTGLFYTTRTGVHHGYHPAAVPPIEPLFIVMALAMLFVLAMLVRF